MAGIQSNTSPIIANKRLAVNDVKGPVTAIRQQGGALASNTANAFDAIQDTVSTILKVLKAPLPPLEEFYVTDTEGNLIAWIGSRTVGNVLYEGIWAKRLYVGGTDPSNSPFFADNNGNVIIGQNGSVEIDDLAGNQVGFLGVEAQTPITITAITSATGLIKITTSVPHTYITGDTVSVLGASGVPGANGDHSITVIDASNFTLDGSTFSGSYTSGGTVARYYGGIWAQSAAFGGTGFSDANIRVFPNGEVLLINSTGSGTTTINNLPDVAGVAGIEVKDNALSYYTVVTQNGFRSYQPGGGTIIDLTHSYSLSTWTSVLSLRDSSGNLAVLHPIGLTFPTTGAAYNDSGLTTGTGTFTSLGTGIVQATSGLLSVFSGALPIVNGGTGATTASGARTNLSVYSISDVNTLLTGYAAHGTYGTSSAGTPAHTHSVAI